MFNDNNAPGGFFMPQDGGNQGQYGGNQGHQQNQFNQPPGTGLFGAPPQGPGAYGGMGGHNQFQGGGFPGQGGFMPQNNMNPMGQMGQMGGQMNQMNQNQYGHNNQMGQPPAQDRRKAKVFTPVTVKMVANSQPRPDDVCEYDGDPINDIILCGRILRRIEEPMRTQFEINDNTGTFYVLFYHKGENQVPTALRNFNYEQFAYVKVYGNIRVFKEEKAIVGTHIKRIEKFDELTNHFLSVYVSHCIRKKGILKPRELSFVTQDQQNPALSNAQNAGSKENSRNNQNYTIGNMQVDQNNRSAGSNNANQAPPGQMFNVRQAIGEVMKQMTKTQKFVNKQQLYQLLQEKVDNQTFEREIDRMMNDGEICTAFDQNHFCLTN